LGEPRPFAEMKSPAVASSVSPSTEVAAGQTQRPSHSKQVGRRMLVLDNCHQLFREEVRWQPGSWPGTLRTVLELAAIFPGGTDIVSREAGGRVPPAI